GLPRVRRGRAHRAARSARPTLPADAGTICRMPVPLPHPTVPPAHTHLLSPLALGPFEVRNRIVMGSMHVGLEDRPADAKKLAAYLGERARGGAGLIVTGGYSPDRTGRLTPGGGQADARTMRGHRVVTREVHEADGRIILQLLHAGRYALRPLAASPPAGQSPPPPLPPAAARGPLRLPPPGRLLRRREVAAVPVPGAADDPTRRAPHRRALRRSGPPRDRRRLRRRRDHGLRGLPAQPVPGPGHQP